jgi:hypothetical protein
MRQSVGGLVEKLTLFVEALAFTTPRTSVEWMDDAEGCGFKSTTSSEDGVGWRRSHHSVPIVHSLSKLYTLKSNREDKERSFETRAVYALDICPSIGLKRAVIVVGGCKGSVRAKGVGDGSGDENTSDDVGSWKEGGVASGNVVKRIPVDTKGVYKIQVVSHDFENQESQTRTSCTLFFRTEIYFGPDGHSTLQTSVYSFFFVYTSYTNPLSQR